MRTETHSFSMGWPVVYAENYKEFVTEFDAAVDTAPFDSNYFTEMSLSGIRVLVFSESMLETLFGAKQRHDVVNATLALWNGKRKYPSSDMDAYTHAIGLATKAEMTNVAESLRIAYERKFGIDLTAKDIPKSPADLAAEDIRALLFQETLLDCKIDMFDVDPVIVIEAISVSDIKKKISVLVKSADESILRKVFAFLNRDSGEYDKTVKILTSIGIPEKHARFVLDTASELGDFDAFSAYMKKRTLTLAKLGKYSNVVDAIKASTGVSDAFSKFLINYQWPTTPSMGAGEAGLIMVLKDGNKPPKGDIGIGSRELEVKGDNGRLKGQHGYGNGELAARVFAEEFGKLMKRVPAEDRIEVPRPGGTDYNPTKTGKSGWAANRLAKVVVNAGVAKPKDIETIWKKAINAVYQKMSVNWVSKYVTANGEITSITSFLEKWLEESARYYHKIEGFEGILLMSRKGKFVVIMPNDFSKLGQLTRWSPPNLSSRAGSQGAAFGISVK